jgi:hypothetical protein
MVYHVSGSNKARRELAERAVEFAESRLTLPENVDICIRLTRARLEDNAHGYCDYQGTYYRRHKIEIEIHSKLSEADFVSTIFHEMKHAEQYCTGVLSECTSFWKGRDYTSSRAYMSLPWEVSARGFEARLLTRWFATQ